MKNWRNIFILSILVGLAACTKVEDVYVPETISYSVGSYANVTKANSHLNDQENITSFRSKAWLHTVENPNGAQFFDEVITYDGTSEWLPSHDYYWPKGPQSYINFVSWHANTGTADIVPAEVTETVFRIADREIGAEDRVLIADEAWRQKNNTTPATYYTTGVPTLFHNLLTRVKVNFSATLVTDPENSNVTYEVILQDAHFEGLYLRGSLTLNNVALDTKGTREWFSTASPTYLWTATSGSNNTNVPLCNTNTTLSVAGTNILAERSFLPQSLNNVNLVLTYTVTTRSGGTITISENNIPATVVMKNIKNASAVAITEWVPNKKYTYNIAINPVNNEILLNPVVETDWSSISDYQYSVTVE